MGNERKTEVCVEKPDDQIEREVLAHFSLLDRIGLRDVFSSGVFIIPDKKRNQGKLLEDHDNNHD